jgi:hypothetical protein
MTYNTRVNAFLVIASVAYAAALLLLICAGKLDAGDIPSTFVAFLALIVGCQTLKKADANRTEDTHLKCEEKKAPLRRGLLKANRQLNSSLRQASAVAIRGAYAADKIKNSRPMSMSQTPIVLLGQLEEQIKDAESRSDGLDGLQAELDDDSLSTPAAIERRSVEMQIAIETAEESTRNLDAKRKKLDLSIQWQAKPSTGKQRPNDPSDGRN